MVVSRSLPFYLLDAGERNHNLDELAQRYLNHTNITIESLIGTGKNQKRMDEAPIASVALYAAEDADVALRLVDLLEPKLGEQGLEPLFRDVEMPLVEMVEHMVRQGFSKPWHRQLFDLVAAPEEVLPALRRQRMPAFS